MIGPALGASTGGTKEMSTIGPQAKGPTEAVVAVQAPARVIIPRLTLSTGVVETTPMVVQGTHQAMAIWMPSRRVS